MSCILRHRGVRLILAYSWARSVILVAGKGRRGMFLLCPRHFQWGAYSITNVRTYVGLSRPVRNTFGFRAMSFERIGVLD